MIDEWNRANWWERVQMLGFAALIGVLIGALLYAGYLVVRPAQARANNPPVSADVCMLTDGRPAYLMVTSTEWFLHITYIDTAGNLVTRELMWNRSTYAFDQPAGVVALPGAKCVTTKQ